MSEPADPPPAPHIDTTVPHSARIWNYWLGGDDNFAVDRDAAERFQRTFPGVVDVARASRQFLARSVRYLAGEADIRQFLDIGTGLPVADNTHEVAQRVAPQSRVVYVDNDPMVLSHARVMLVSRPEGMISCVGASIREPDEILVAAAKTLDFTRPVAVILSGVIGHVPDTGEARSIIATLLAALPSGSYLCLNDRTSVVAGEKIELAQQDYDNTGADPYKLRTPEEIADFFDGLGLVEPGVVSCPQWRPDADTTGPAELDAFGGVGHKL